MSTVSRVLISILFTLVGGLLFMTIVDEVDTSYGYLCGFIVGFASRHIQGK